MFNLLSKKSIGLEIADRSIEVVKLEKRKKLEILSSGRVELEEGIVERGRIKDEKKLFKKIKEVFNKAKPEKINFEEEIVFGLPEAQVYVNSFQIEKTKDKENLIKDKIKSKVPLPVDRLKYSYSVIGKEGDKENIVSIASDEEVIKEWKEFFNRSGINVVVFDPEPLAIFRGLLIEEDKRPVCIIDMGAEMVNLSIFEKEGLSFNYCISKAGSFLTDKVSEKLKISIEEAEKEKKKVELSREDKVSLVLRKELKNNILNDIKKAIDFFEGETGKKIELSILVGGTSKIKGLADFMLRIIGRKFFNLYSVKKEGGADVVFLEAVGLALRKINGPWKEKDPFFK